MFHDITISMNSFLVLIANLWSVICDHKVYNITKGNRLLFLGYSPMQHANIILLSLANQ